MKSRKKDIPLTESELKLIRKGNKQALKHFEELAE